VVAPTAGTCPDRDVSKGVGAGGTGGEGVTVWVTASNATRAGCGLSNCACRAAAVASTVMQVLAALQCLGA
jgi:hypothetical protein